MVLLKRGFFTRWHTVRTIRPGSFSKKKKVKSSDLLRSPRPLRRGRGGKNSTFIHRSTGLRAQSRFFRLRFLRPLLSVTLRTDSEPIAVQSMLAFFYCYFFFFGLRPPIVIASPPHHPALLSNFFFFQLFTVRQTHEKSRTRDSILLRYHRDVRVHYNTILCLASYRGIAAFLWHGRRRGPRDLRGGDRVETNTNYVSTRSL